MRHEAPAPPELGTKNGLSYALFLPDAKPVAGIVILHGAGSAKESHFDFGRAARAHGLAALAFDARGHGRSVGAFGPAALDDVLSMLSLMSEHAPALALRGSSMGGFLAIHAAALHGDLAAVVALCPASSDLLLRGLRSGRLLEFDCDREATEPWLETLDTFGAVEALAGRTSLLLMHARGDEQIPYTMSEEMYKRAGDPKRLLLMPGGHHRSLQHDAELQGVALHFVVEAARRRAAEAAG